MPCRFNITYRWHDFLRSKFLSLFSQSYSKLSRYLFCSDTFSQEQSYLDSFPGIYIEVFSHFDHCNAFKIFFFNGYFLLLLVLKA